MMIRQSWFGFTGLVLIGLLMVTVRAQAVRAQDLAEEPGIPSTWHGQWKGTLEIAGTAGAKRKVPLTLEISPDNGANDKKQWIWKITYRPPGEPESVRDYKLVLDKKGRLQIDEQNGVLLDASLFENTIHCRFELRKMFFTARYKLEKDTIHFEVTSSIKNEESGAKDGTLTSYRVITNQSAVLKKVK